MYSVKDLQGSNIADIEYNVVVIESSSSPSKLCKVTGWTDCCQLIKEKCVSSLCVPTIRLNP